MAFLFFLLAAYLSAVVDAKIITIRAIDNRFLPNVTSAAVGDLLEFHFLPHNHSVVMGDVDNACQPSKTCGGFYSGFFAVAAGQEAGRVFRVPINDTTPFVYYCSQGTYGWGHCQDGMVGAVNYPDAQVVLQRYADAASRAVFAGTPDGGPFGGTFADVSAGVGNTTTTCGCTTATTTTTVVVVTSSATTTSASYQPTVVSSSAAVATRASLGAAAGLALAILVA